MSDLATVSAEIAPYLALAANSLGTSVLAAAQDRIAERTVTPGEGFFRRLLRLRDTALGDDPAQPLFNADRADALDRLLDTLDGGERRLLAAALAAWLNSSERDADGFLRHVAQLAADAPRTIHNGPTATGHISMGGSGHDGHTPPGPVFGGGNGEADEW